MILLQCCQDISMAFLCIQRKTQACFFASAYAFSLYSHSAEPSSSAFLQLCAWHTLPTVKNAQLLQLHVAIFHSKGHYRSYLDAIAKVTQVKLSPRIPAGKKLPVLWIHVVFFLIYFISLPELPLENLNNRNEFSRISGGLEVWG